MISLADLLLLLTIPAIPFVGIAWIALLSFLDQIEPYLIQLEYTIRRRK